MNINTIQQAYGMNMPNTSSEMGSSHGGKAANTSNIADTVYLSEQGKTLSELPPLILPTRENVQQLSVALSGDLNKLFNEAGINPDPAVEFDVDSYTGKVSVNESRPDAQKIAKLLKKNPDIESQIHNVAAISSHVVAIAQAMGVRSAQNAAAKYASIYNGQNKVTDFSLIFNGENLQVNANGAAWLTSKAL